jgi:hypothetical protein
VRGGSATGGSLRWNDPDRFDGFDLSRVAAAPQAVHRMMGIPAQLHKPTPAGLCVPNIRVLTPETLWGASRVVLFWTTLSRVVTNIFTRKP